MCVGELIQFDDQLIFNAPGTLSSLGVGEEHCGRALVS